MADVVDAATRSRMMSGIKGKNTKPEMTLRRGLHRLGFRYRLHRNDLPGRPDLVFPARRVAIFVHGCFWHSHGCKYFKWPGSNASFWKNKITGNAARDALAQKQLRKLGWKVIVVWECDLRERPSQTVARTANILLRRDPRRVS